MKRVLLLEDFTETRKWLREVLEAALKEIHIDEAATIEQARKLISENTYVIAVIDLHLPDGSGSEMMAEIFNRTPETCCVVATIFDDDQHLFPALEAGAQGYLLKDQAKEKMIEQLQGVAKGEPALSPSIARRVLRYFSQNPQNTMSKKINSNLTDREEEVLALLAKGVSRRDVANMLGVSSNTVASHVKAIYEKLHISSRSEAALEAVRLGLIQPNY